MCLFPSRCLCSSFLQQILAHQDFAHVHTLHCFRHRSTALARLCLCRQSAQGRRRLHTLSLPLLRHRQHLQETRTSSYTQPLPHCSHPQNTRQHTKQPSSSSSSATPATPTPTSLSGKRAGPSGNKKDKSHRILHLQHDHPGLNS